MFYVYSSIFGRMGSAIACRDWAEQSADECRRFFVAGRPEYLEGETFYVIIAL